jgi:hypothetical protein
MSSATAAGRPEKKTVQPPRTPAQASRPLTIEVPSEESASQRMWMMAGAGIATNLRRDCDENGLLAPIFVDKPLFHGFSLCEVGPISLLSGLVDPLGERGGAEVDYDAVLERLVVVAFAGNARRARIGAGCAAGMT